MHKGRRQNSPLIAIETVSFLQPLVKLINLTYAYQGLQVMVILTILRSVINKIWHSKGRRQNCLPLTTIFSQNVTEPSKGITYPGGDLCRHFTKLTGPCAYTLVIRYPQQMVQMAFCDLSHTFHKQVTNVSQHVFVILLWGILTSPLNN